MRYIRSVFAVILSLAVLSPVFAEVPTVNLPGSLYQANWTSPWRRGRQGSCVHASIVMLMRWQGRYDWADYWRSWYSGGANPSSINKFMTYHKIPYAETNGKKDVAFLEWSLRTRRGCVVSVSNGPLYGYQGRIRHVVLLVYMDDKVVGVLDNNHGYRIKWVRRDDFLSDWFGYYSWALVPLLDSPAPPIPDREAPVDFSDPVLYYGRGETCGKGGTCEK